MSRDPDGLFRLSWSYANNVMEQAQVQADIADMQIHVGVWKTLVQIGANEPRLHSFIPVLLSGCRGVRAACAAVRQLDRGGGPRLAASSDVLNEAFQLLYEHLRPVAQRSDAATRGEAVAEMLLLLNNDAYDRTCELRASHRYHLEMIERVRIAAEVIDLSACASGNEIVALREDLYELYRELRMLRQTRTDRVLADARAVIRETMGRFYEEAVGASVRR